jgi:Tetratricopeptide repeat
MKTNFLKVLLLVSLFTSLQAQAQLLDWFGTPKPDPTKMLILNNGVQTEVGKAVNLMYNFKFDEAEREFRWFKYKYAYHPMPYMLLGLNEWWKIIPNTDNPLYDEQCLAYMDSTIAKAEYIYESSDDRKVEACFFMAAAYGFKARLYSERKKWTKATFAGKNSLKYLEKVRGFEDLSPELQFGDGLYNYYVEWIPANYPLLKPILWLFPNGNKEKGIKDLEKVANFAFYTRMEARYFLLQIYGMENQHEKGYQMAKYTHEHYPDNAYFHRHHAIKAFATGHASEAVSEAESILDKLQKHYAGYEGVSGRYASYILAYNNHFYLKDYEKAKKYYQQTINFAIQTNASKSGYHVSSLLGLGKIAKEEGQYDQAIDYYKQALDITDRKMSQRDEAKRLIDEAKKLKKQQKKK